MSLFVEAFKATLVGGGARPNLFRVTVNFPTGAQGNTTRTSFLCKSASLPASTVGSVAVPFRGRTINVAGDRTFDTWSITVYNDVDFGIRNSFERWMSIMNTHETNTGFGAPVAYKQDLEVTQLDKSGVNLKTYKIVGAFPTSLAAIDLAYDTNDTVEEFGVDFAIDYWTADTTA